MLSYRTPVDPAAVVADLAEVYRRVFAEPPYHEGEEQFSEFVENYAKQARSPGFHLVTAHDDTALVGFAYGAGEPAGWWWGNCDADPPDDLKQAAKFAVYEWAVLPNRRGEGIGRALLSRLLAGRPEPWATLTVNPAAAAYRIYQQAGWVQIGICHKPGWPAMPAMALRLTDQ